METRQLLETHGIDPDISMKILETVRRMDKEGKASKLDIEGFPRISPADSSMFESQDSLAIDISRPQEFAADVQRQWLETRLADSGIPMPLIGKICNNLPDSLRLDESLLYRIGLAALPLVSYGILNGGSATSYADEKKNRNFNPELFTLYRDAFEVQAEQCRGRAKGLTPGYLNPDGSPGASYIELKIRAALLLAAEHYREFPESRNIHQREPDWPEPLFPMFQMTSSGNDAEILDAYAEYRSSPWIKDLTNIIDADPLEFITGVQPLVAALTHSSKLDAQTPRDIFLNAWGEADRPLALPGGHGQNFYALESAYRQLEAGGKRYAILGNVDNLACIPDPREIALLILRDSPAGFDFSYKTPVDVKGGILVMEPSGALNCGDIGVAVSTADVDEAAAGGTPILFNCASGIFDLKWLCSNLKEIQTALPLRLSDQDKDSGMYAQAEQVTWEIMGLVSGFTVFGVDKFRRFLAGKLLLENMMTGGFRIDEETFPNDLAWVAGELNKGFERLMRQDISAEYTDGHWLPSDTRH